MTALPHSDHALADQKIVVTGAGGGIGSAAVDTFLALGASVVAVDLAGAGLDAVRERQNGGDSVVAVEGDVTSVEDWARIAAAMSEHFGVVTGLVNNAGIEGAIVPLVEYPEEMFDRVLDINVKGVWLGMKTLAPLMSGGGSIVNVSSVAGLGGASNLSAYSASKHAVIGLSKSAALELAPQGIRVNAVCPSPIQTRMMRSLEGAMKTDDIDLETMQAVVAANIPIGRYGEPSEVADLMSFLLSDQSRFLSGAAIPIDGAMKAR